MAAAKDISVIDAVAAVSSEVDGIFIWTRRKSNGTEGFSRYFCFGKSLVWHSGILQLTKTRWRMSSVAPHTKEQQEALICYHPKKNPILMW